MTASAECVTLPLLSLASIGGDYAAQNAGLTPRFTLLLVGLTLLFMALTEWIARAHDAGVVAVDTETTHLTLQLN